MTRRTQSPRAVNVRREAHRMLQRLDDPASSVYAAELIDDFDARLRLSGRDRRFLTEITYGVLRHRGTLDTIIAAFSRTPLAELSPPITAALRLGLYQVLYLDGVPPFAAVATAVDLIRERHLKSFVNGMLRGMLRELNKVPLAADRGGASPSKRLPLGANVAFFSREVFADPASEPALHLSQVLSYPLVLVQRWLERYGWERAERLLRHLNQRPELIVRVNLHRITLARAVEELRTAGIASEPLSETALRIGGSATDLLKSRPFRTGLLTVQGPFAQEAIPLLDAKGGMLCVDLCAAPGGKTTHLSEQTKGAARILACDVEPARLRRVMENVSRLRLAGIQPLVFDARRPLALRRPPERVLLDVPCSNTAVLSRRPEARWRFSPERLASLTALQRALIASGATLLERGGRLLYSTCSIEPDENESVVQGLLQSRPGLRLIAERTALPGEGTDDGGYLALLEREA